MRQDQMYMACAHRCRGLACIDSVPQMQRSTASHGSCNFPKPVLYQIDYAPHVSSIVATLSFLLQHCSGTRLQLVLL